MLRKQEQYSEHSSLYLVLNAGAQYIQMIAGTLDTCSTYRKAEISAAMAQLIDLVTEATAENSEPKLQTKRKNS
jgi:adenosylmethionine-8-amino-7-oxononanoate aminotransferase